MMKLTALLTAATFTLTACGVPISQGSSYTGGTSATVAPLMWRAASFETNLHQL